VEKPEDNAKQAKYRSFTTGLNFISVPQVQYLPQLGQ
jgi:hypothetical protein